MCIDFCEKEAVLFSFYHVFLKRLCASDGSLQISRPAASASRPQGQSGLRKGMYVAPGLHSAGL